MNRRLVNQTAFLMARALLGQLKEMVKPEDHRMAFEFLFDTCKDGLTLYDEERQRIEHRLHPINNGDVR